MKKMKSSKPKYSKSEDTKSKDIIDLILRDHEPIKKLILVLKDAAVGIDKKRPVYSEFEQILSNHAKAEEESLYVRMKSGRELRIEALEGNIEHELADQLMGEINQQDNEDEWMAKVKVLSELVDHHVKEEEKEVLKQIKKEFDGDERMEMGRQYSQLLTQLQEENEEDQDEEGDKGSRPSKEHASRSVHL